VEQQTDRQTDKHTNAAEKPTHATTVSVGINRNNWICRWPKIVARWFQLVSRTMLYSTQLNFII